MKKFTLSVLLALLANISFAQAPDWSNEIASIIYSNCSSCHHEGGIGTFSLMTYQDAVDHAISIQSYVTAGKMPPWPPNPDCSQSLIGDRRLSDDDINAINDWVNNGAPSGNLATAPPPPIFASNSALDQIDQTIQLPLYTVQLPTDEYRTFVVHSGYSGITNINQIEVMAGNSAIVHHVLVYYDATTASYDLDQVDPLPGFSTNGTNTPSTYAILIGGWAPGSQPQKLPANMAYQVPANSDFVVEVHYAPGSMGQIDSTKINLKFCADPAPRLMHVNPILFHLWPSLTNGPLLIPANTIETFYEKSVGFTFDENGDYSLFSVAPHMHLIGKSISVYMTSPDNLDTTRLVCIPDWNFHWQLGYAFEHLIHFNSGDDYTLRAEATYDNTQNNPNNPSNPPVQVSLGESTTDEMMVVFFTYLDYQPGDENLVLTGTGELLNPSDISLSLYPNPAISQVELSGWISGNDVKIQLLNSMGATVKTIVENNHPTGAYTTTIDISGLPPGIYFIVFNSGEQHVVKKLVRM